MVKTAAPLNGSPTPLRARAKITSHFYAPMHPAWLCCPRAEISRYSRPWASCQTGASTPKNVNLFLREPLNMIKPWIENSLKLTKRERRTKYRLAINIYCIAILPGFVRHRIAITVPADGRIYDPLPRCGRRLTLQGSGHGHILSIHCLRTCTKWRSYVRKRLYPV